MSETSRPVSLKERLRRRIDEDRSAIKDYREQCQEQIRSELQQLADGLRRPAADARRRIASDLDDMVDRQRSVLTWTWGLPLAAGIALWLLILAGSWMTAQWQLWRIESRGEQLEQLEEEIERQRHTLEQLEENTWGIELLEVVGARYILLPRGGKVLDHESRAQSPTWTVEGRPAVKLAPPD